MTSSAFGSENLRAVDLEPLASEHIPSVSSGFPNSLADLVVRSSQPAADLAPVKFDYRYGGSFFDLFRSGDFSPNEQIVYYDLLKEIFSSAKAQENLVEDFCMQPKHHENSFTLLLNALGQQYVIFPRGVARSASQLRDSHSTKLFELALEYAVGKWADNQAYLKAFFQTFACTLDPNYLSALSTEDLFKFNKIVKNKLSHLSIFSEKFDSNFDFDLSNQVKFGTLYAHCLNDSEADKIFAAMLQNLSNSNAGIEVNHMAYAALAAYDPCKFDAAFGLIQGTFIEPKDSYFKPRSAALFAKHLMSDSILEHSFGVAFTGVSYYFMPAYFYFAMLATGVNSAYLLYKSIVSFKQSSAKNFDKIQKAQSAERLQYQKEKKLEQVLPICYAASKNNQSLYTLLTFLEQSVLKDSEKLLMIKSISENRSFDVELSAGVYIGMLKERLADGLQIEDGFNGLINICYLLREHYQGLSQNVPISLKSQILNVSNFLPGNYKRLVNGFLEQI